MLAYVSLWSADLLALGDAVDEVAEEADAFHIDVFDGHNVRELLFGPDLVAALRARTSLPLDVHLNVTDPDYWLGRFIDAGADMVTVQSEASPDIRATLETVRTRGASPSLGLEVHEPVERAERLFEAVERVLVMGTEIGIKGVGLDPATPARISALVAAREQRFGPGGGPPIVVDGGIRPHTVGPLAEAGADGVVPGSLVFGRPDPLAAIRELHALGPRTR
ncbi:MAG: Ribulose-phosphate 3-epimerase [Acidimicrobiaceae bacterium]|nr:Ribulose-phosphate 3-epimerase [Acidimicrobiaceae bacterium]